MMKNEGIPAPSLLHKRTLTNREDPLDLTCPECMLGLVTPVFIDFGRYMFLCKRKVGAPVEEMKADVSTSIHLASLHDQ
jgi:hypothetical protein